YFVLTLVLAYPLTVHPATSVLPMGADTNLLMWLLQWDAHALVRQPSSIFDANIYYPYHHTLAYAENLIGSALIAAPVLWVTANPVLALNVVALLSCVLCGAGVYLLARRVGVSPLGAALAGIIFAFARAGAAGRRERVPALPRRAARNGSPPVARRVVPLLAQCCELSCVADASACVPAVAPRERAGSAGCQSISVPGLPDARARRD